MRTRLCLSTAVVVTLALSGCGGSASSASSSAPPAPTTLPSGDNSTPDFSGLLPPADTRPATGPDCSSVLIAALNSVDLDPIEVWAAATDPAAWAASDAKVDAALSAWPETACSLGVIDGVAILDPSFVATFYGQLDPTMATFLATPAPVAT